MSFKDILMKDIVLFNKIKSYIPVDIENIIFSFLYKDDIIAFNKRIKLVKYPLIKTNLLSTIINKQEHKYPSIVTEYKKKSKKTKIIKKSKKTKKNKYYKFSHFNLKNHDENFYLLNPQEYNRLWYGNKQIHISHNNTYYKNYFIETFIDIHISDKNYFIILDEYIDKYNKLTFNIKQKTFKFISRNELSELMSKYCTDYYPFRRESKINYFFNILKNGK